MNKPKLNQPDVEQSTTDIALETQDIIDSQYVTKKFEMVGDEFIEISAPTEQEVLKEFEENYIYDLYDDKIVLRHKTSSHQIVISKSWELVFSTYRNHVPAPLSFNDIKNIFKFLEVKGWIK